MEKTKDQIVTEMYQAGLLNEDDTARYLIDESVSASDMNEVKQMIELCKERAKSNSKSYTLEEVDKIIRGKYFANRT